jgi:sugar (pentulose or hexulose) kinase
VLAGAVATGALPSVEAAAATVRPGPAHEPDPATADRYDAAYERFVAARTSGATRA